MAEKALRSLITFEEQSINLFLTQIMPLRVVKPAIKATKKYKQIAASIAEVGLVEPPIVARYRDEPSKFLLLDGHIRLEILRERGAECVDCLISIDDEAYTFNKRISRLSVFQEHKMIRKAIKRGVSERQIAAALDIDVKLLRSKMREVEGVCPEAAELLKDKDIKLKTLSILRRVVPYRQIEMAEVMVAMNVFTWSYAQSLLAATPELQLVDPKRGKRPKGLTPKQIELMEREAISLDRQFRLAEENYAKDMLDLVLMRRFLERLLGNSKVVRYLSRNHPEIQAEFERLSSDESTAN